MKNILILLSAIMLAGGFAFAQEGEALYNTYDADADGAITEQEWYEGTFGTFDENDDAALDEEEFEEYEAWDEQEAMDFGDFDANGDGSIGEDEWLSTWGV